MNYLEATKLLEEGFPVKRKDWTFFLFKQVPADISVETIVPKMQSLPEQVKAVLVKRMLDTPANPELHFIKYREQYVVVSPDNYISQWHPKPEDVGATDYVLVK